MVAGLQKPNFTARTSSTGRATTSAKLSKTSRSSSFSQAKSASAVSYGISAQRTTAGSGLFFNPSQYNSDYISVQRHQINDKRLGIYNNDFGMFDVNSGNPNPKMSTLEKIALLGSLTNKVVGDAFNFAGAVKNLKKAKAGNLSTTTSKMDGGAKADTPAAVTDMKNAKTSKDLDAAIKSAEGKSTTTLNSDIEKAEGELTNLEGKTAGLQTAYDQASGAVKQNDNAITIKDNDIKKLKSDLYELLKQNSDGPETQEITNKRAEIAKAEQELEALKAQTDKLKKEEAKAENELKANENDIKTKKEDISKLKAQKQSIDNELISQKNRLTKLQNQERGTLTRLSSQLNDFKAKYQKETNDDKKAQILRDYKAKCGEYNSLLNNSSVTGFSAFNDYIE